MAGLNPMDEGDLTCWVPGASNSEFSIHNLPLGIFSVGGGPKRAGVAIGNQVVDLTAAHHLGIFEGLLAKDVLELEQLNAFINLGKPTTTAVRERLQSALCDEHSPLRDSTALRPRESVTMHLPVKIGDYTDFYSSLEHATNVGSMFRDPSNPLPPNWRHMPIAYHGRASSIIPSGQPIYRPYGQTLNEDGSIQFGPTRQLDFELEVALVVGKPTRLGEFVPTDRAEEHIFGLLLFNDWSARDIQRWEYVPLGPFLGKNFASSVSPWIVPIEALAPFRAEGPKQAPPPLPHLVAQGAFGFDIDLSVELHTDRGDHAMVCQSNFKYLYWNMCQQIAHHTSNGCNLNVGDLMASGTISGPVEGSYGSMLELTRGGKEPLRLSEQVSRSFLQDGDQVIMRGSAFHGSGKVGFGDLTTKILPGLM